MNTSSTGGLGRSRGAAAGGGLPLDEEAHRLIEEFLADVGPGGALRQLAQAGDSQLGSHRVDSVNGQHLQLDGAYDARRGLYWRQERNTFELDGKDLSRAEATGALVAALKAHPHLAAGLRRTMEHQRRMFVEDTRHTFTDLRTRYGAGLLMRDALEARGSARRSQAGMPRAFKNGDAAGAARTLLGLKRARDLVEAKLDAQIQALPLPRTFSEKAGYLARLGYAPEVATKLLEKAPHLAKAVIELSRKMTRLPEEAKEEWKYYFRGDLAFQPATLLRGIDAEQFDPRWVVRFDKLAGKEFTFFSEQLGYPFMRSIWSYTGGTAHRDRKQGLIVEFQVPKLLVMTADNGHPVLVQKMVPDQEVLVRRIGLVPFTRDAANISDCATPEKITMVEWLEGPALTEAQVLTPPHPEKPPARLEVFDPAEWLR